jgi:hypothetical protein
VQSLSQIGLSYIIQAITETIADISSTQAKVYHKNIAEYRFIKKQNSKPVSCETIR